MKTRSLVRLFPLLFDPRVARYKKQIFLVLVIGYWLAPDLMPLIPVDDLLFTLFGSWLFVQSAENDLNKHGGNKWKPSRNNGDYIDVEGYVIEDEEQ